MPTSESWTGWVMEYERVASPIIRVLGLDDGDDVVFLREALGAYVGKRVRVTVEVLEEA